MERAGVPVIPGCSVMPTLEKAREDVALQQKEQIGDAKITAQEETVEVRDGVLYYRVDVDCEENIGVESEVFLQS